MDLWANGNWEKSSTSIPHEQVEEFLFQLCGVADVTKLLLLTIVFDLLKIIL